MVRIASLKDMIHVKYQKKDIAGMTPKEQIEKILPKTHKLMKDQYSTYNRLLPELNENGLEVVTRHEDLSEVQSKFVDEYFEKNVYPVLTPMAVDSSRPFPLIRNKTLNIGALITKKGHSEEMDLATVQVPGVLPRVVKIPS